MRKITSKLVWLAAILTLAGVSADAAPRRGPATFYDQQGQFRGYAWCLSSRGAVSDCNYFNRAQCEMSASGRRGYCVPNPFSYDYGGRY